MQRGPSRDSLDASGPAKPPGGMSPTARTQRSSPALSTKASPELDHMVALLPGGFAILVNIENPTSTAFLPDNPAADFEVCFSNSRNKEYVYSAHLGYSTFVTFMIQLIFSKKTSCKNACLFL